MLRLPRNLVVDFGGEAAMSERVAAFRAALDAHALTVDVPAPIEHPLIEGIARAGGWGSVEIIEPPPPQPQLDGPLPPAVPAPPPFPMDGPIEAQRAVAAAYIDYAAELKRLQHLTPGGGQALEYQATEAEARRWQEGEPLEAYPFLIAEADAIELATGERPDAATLVATVLAQADAWINVGSAIKRERRARKLRVAAAGDRDAILAIIAEPWPAS